MREINNGHAVGHAMHTSLFCLPAQCTFVVFMVLYVMFLGGYLRHKWLILPIIICDILIETYRCILLLREISLYFGENILYARADCDPDKSQNNEQTIIFSFASSKLFGRSHSFRIRSSKNSIIIFLSVYYFGFGHLLQSRERMREKWDGKNAMCDCFEMLQFKSKWFYNIYFYRILHLEHPKLCLIPVERPQRDKPNRKKKLLAFSIIRYNNNL